VRALHALTAVLLGLAISLALFGFGVAAFACLAGATVSTVWMIGLYGIDERQKH
jgi:hypothetical protein